MQQVDDLDQLARPYADALVAALKSEGKLSSPLVEAAFKQVPRHPFIDHFFLLERNDRRIQWRQAQPSTGQKTHASLRPVYTNQPAVTAFSECTTPASAPSSPHPTAFLRRT